MVANSNEWLTALGPVAMRADIAEVADTEGTKKLQTCELCGASSKDSCEPQAKLQVNKLQ